MPIYQWQPKDGPHSALKHVGPTAQDFYAAFELGDSDKAIGMQDAEGIALAAIQGLHQVVQEKDGKIEAQQRAIDAQRSELATVKERLSELDRLRDELNALKRALPNENVRDAK